MWNFQDTFETCKQSFISAFSICMTVPLNQFCKICLQEFSQFPCSILGITIQLNYQLFLREQYSFITFFFEIWACFIVSNDTKIFLSEGLVQAFYVTLCIFE